MDDIIANVDNMRFDIEVALEMQLGIQPLPFPGMDSKFSVPMLKWSLLLHSCEALFLKYQNIVFNEKLLFIWTFVT